MDADKHEITKENNWLLSYKNRITSQFGEDGIIKKIFEIINGNKWCVEFGASDGKYLSNTRDLLENKNWSGVLIEANKKRFKELVLNSQSKERVICLNKHVSFSGPNSLDQILKNTPIPQDFDLLSIDIDGCDYYIWKSIKEFKPKVVIIEFNPSIPNHVRFIQSKNPKYVQGSSLLSICELGKKKGYELIAATQINGIFVKKQYFKLFHIKDNSLSAMYDGSKCQTYLFQLYDGTLMIAGCDDLLWHGKKIKLKRLQVLPRFIRKYPTNYPWIYKIYKKIRKRIGQIIKSR